MHDLVGDCLSLSSVSKWKIKEEHFRRVLLHYLRKGKKRNAVQTRVFSEEALILRQCVLRNQFAKFRYQRGCRTVLGRKRWERRVTKLPETWQKVIYLISYIHIILYEIIIIISSI